MKTSQTAAALTHRDLEGSGSDFGFTDEENTNSPYGDDDDYGEFSGSGDGGEHARLQSFIETVRLTFEIHPSVSIATTASTRGEFKPSAQVRNISWR